MILIPFETPSISTLGTLLKLWSFFSPCLFRLLISSIAIPSSQIVMTVTLCALLLGQQSEVFASTQPSRKRLNRVVRPEFPLRAFPSYEVLSRKPNSPRVW